jgi:hypothetical protein
MIRRFYRRSLAAILLIAGAAMLQGCVYGPYAPGAYPGYASYGYPAYGYPGYAYPAYGGGVVVGPGGGYRGGYGGGGYQGGYGERH